MTPERLAGIERKITSACSAQDYQAYPNNEAVRDLDALVFEVKRLRCELIEAHLTAEEAWAALDEVAA